MPYFIAFLWTSDHAVRVLPIHLTVLGTQTEGACSTQETGEYRHVFI